MFLKSLAMRQLVRRLVRSCLLSQTRAPQQPVCLPHLFRLMRPLLQWHLIRPSCRSRLQPPQDSSRHLRRLLRVSRLVLCRGILGCRRKMHQLWRCSSTEASRGMGLQRCWHWLPIRGCVACWSVRPRRASLCLPSLPFLQVLALLSQTLQL